MGLLWMLLAFNANMRLWVTGSLQPAIIDEYHITPSTVGLFVSLLTVAQGIFVVPIASLMNGGGVGWARKYRYAILVIGYVALTLAKGLTFLTATLLALLVIQCAQKILSGAGESAEVTIVNEWWPVEKRGFAQGLHRTAYPWGTFLGGLAVAGILSIVGVQNWRVVFLTLPLLALPILLAYWRFSTGQRYRKFSEQTLDGSLTPPLAGDVEVRQQAPANIVKRAAKNPNIVVPSVVFGICCARLRSVCESSLSRRHGVRVQRNWPRARPKWQAFRRRRRDNVRFCRTSLAGTNNEHRTVRRIHRPHQREIASPFLTQLTKEFST